MTDWRQILGLVLTLSAPHGAAAWTFSPTPICTIEQIEAEIAVTVTYDPGSKDYAITLTRPGTPWAPAPVFAIAFAPNGPTISTPRHQIDGARVSVTDSGFGNVLNGLQYNATATAILGAQQITFDLAAAAPAVEAFRACAETAPIARLHHDGRVTRTSQPAQPT